MKQLEYIKTVKGPNNGLRNQDWYAVKFDYAAREYTGYVAKACMYDVKTYSYSDDASFEQSISAFPNSYKPYLRKLHAMHPNWTFKADYTNLNWEEAAEAERIANEEAEKKAQAEKYAKLNATGKSIANGYIYHGAEEVEKNCKLFANGALESGHAYYISGFIVKYGGSMAKIEYGDGFFFSSQSNAVYVDYVNQKVKGEVVEAGVTNLFGQTIETPITVIVAGGKGVTKIPVVLGIIEEK